MKMEIVLDERKLRQDDEPLASYYGKLDQWFSKRNVDKVDQGIYVGTEEDWNTFMKAGLEFPKYQWFLRIVKSWYLYEDGLEEENKVDALESYNRIVRHKNVIDDFEPLETYAPMKMEIVLDERKLRQDDEPLASYYGKLDQWFSKRNVDKVDQGIYVGTEEDWNTFMKAGLEFPKYPWFLRIVKSWYLYEDGLEEENKVDALESYYRIVRNHD